MSPRGNVCRDLRLCGKKTKLQSTNKKNKRSVTRLYCGGGGAGGREEDLPLPSPHCKEACSLKMAVYFR